MPLSIHSSPPFASEVAQARYLSAAARHLAPKVTSPQEFLDWLEGEGLWEDAVKYRSRLLPKRSAVWWGCLCVWHAVRPQPSAVLEEAMRSAAYWVADPDEPNRRRAEVAGHAAGLGTGPGCLATAAFYSSGSIVDAKLPVVEPPPDATAQAVAAAVLLAAGPPPGSGPLLRQFLTLAAEVENGQLPWPPSRKPGVGPAPGQEGPHGDRPAAPDSLDVSLGQSWHGASGKTRSEGEMP